LTADRCGKVLGTHPDFVLVFEAISDNVQVSLEVMASVVLQSLFGKRGDNVVGGYLESLADPSPVRTEEVALGITAFADDAFEDFPVVRSSHELESDFDHVISLFVWAERWSNRLPLSTHSAVRTQLGVWGTFCVAIQFGLALARFPNSSSRWSRMASLDSIRS